jgi:hypothetical protein
MPWDSPQGWLFSVATPLPIMPCDDTRAVCGSRVFARAQEWQPDRKHKMCWR